MVRAVPVFEIEKQEIGQRKSDLITVDTSSLTDERVMLLEEFSKKYAMTIGRVAEIYEFTRKVNLNYTPQEAYVMQFPNKPQHSGEINKLWKSQVVKDLFALDYTEDDFVKYQGERARAVSKLMDIIEGSNDEKLIISATVSLEKYTNTASKKNFEKEGFIETISVLDKLNATLDRISEEGQFIDSEGEIQDIEVIE